jgi:hypothetical protein
MAEQTSPSVEARTPLHTRTIRLDGYGRPDGLYDIEARITDVKHYEVPGWGKGPLRPGDPMHDMQVTMTVDAEGTIRAFEARTLAAPHAVCPSATPAFGRLVGLRIHKGFLKAASERVGGVQGCTHIRELLQQMATVAFQTMRESRLKTLRQDPERRPPLIDSCVAWSAAGEWVKVRFPKWWTGGDRARDGTGDPTGAR